MYARLLKVPSHSFFLFGPRATGKTTWLKNSFSNAKWYNLLKNDLFLKYSLNPELIREEILELEEGTWVIVDEIQKIPEILNEVHYIISEFGDKYKFAITGSSARKLKKEQSNLLAGRLITKNFYPITFSELKESGELSQINIRDILKYGQLPDVLMKKEYRLDILESYANTYLQTEIKEEAVTRNLNAFNRFLQVAAMLNGQIVNLSNVARETGVARTTVERYFDILVDTLIGRWLPAWRPHAKIKETSRSKFYFFDAGVCRTLNRRLRKDLDSSYIGALFELLILNELEAINSFNNLSGNLYYWRTPSDSEIDFIWELADQTIGIEVKTADNWKKSWGRELKDLYQDKKLDKIIAVYLGENSISDGELKILSLKDFVDSINKIATGQNNA